MKTTQATNDHGSEPLAVASCPASEDALVYSGKHYGRQHRILLDTGRLVTVLHEPSGYVVTVPYFDVERLPTNVRTERQPPGCAHDGTKTI